MNHHASTARTAIAAAWCSVAVAVCVGALLAIALAMPAQAGPLSFQPPTSFAGLLQPPAFAPGEVIVRYERGTTPARRARLWTRVAAARSAQPLPLPRMELVQLRKGESVQRAVRRLNRAPGVLYAEPNYVRAALAVPDDPSFAQQWGMHNTGQVTRDDETGKDVTAVPDSDIDATDAWDLTTGSRAVRVGVLDSGMLYDHPDLRANLGVNAGESGGGKETNGVDDDRNGFVDDWRGWDFTGRTGRRPDNDPLDIALHGTHVAGTIAAVGNNGVGVAGVAWQASLVPLKFIDDQGFGTVAQSIAAYRYARDNGIRVVNGSFGGPERSRAELDALRASPDVLFVFAAGNDGADNDGPLRDPSQRSDGGDDDEDEELGELLGGPPPSYPASYARVLPNVMSIAASTTKDGRAAFSNYGRHSVDLAAPGTSVFSTFRATPLFEDQLLEDLQGRWARAGSKSRWSWDNLFRVLDTNPVTITWRCATRGGGSSGVRVCQGTPRGRYENDSNAILQQVAPMQLAGRTGCVLHLSEYHDLQKNRDFLLLEGSTDAGATWQRIGKPISGTRGGLTNRNLSQFDGAQQLWLRLRLTSDRRVGRLGAHLFAIWVDTCQPQQYEYERASGSSMAAPHVTGAAALVLTRHPDADPAWVRQAIDRGADPVESWIGRTRTGARLNVRGALDVAVSAAMEQPIEFRSELPRRRAVVRFGRPIAFRWRRSGADSGIARYELFVDDRLVRTLGRSADSFRLRTRVARGRHTWRVEAVDRDGDRRVGETRSLRVR